MILENRLNKVEMLIKEAIATATVERTNDPNE